MFLSNFLEISCVVHKGECNGDGKLVAFTEDTLKKCNNILIARKQQNLKYQDIFLPHKIDGISGFRMDCYRRFTALSKAQRFKMACEPVDKTVSTAQDINMNSSRIMRSEVTSPKPSSSTGIFPKLCIICGKEQKSHKKQKQKLVCTETSNLEKNIRTYARWLEDHQLLARIETINFTTKEVHYHGICRIKYQHAAEATLIGKKEMEENKTRGDNYIFDSKKSEWHHIRETHKQAFEAICCFIDEKIMGNMEVYMLKDINNQYQELLYEIGGSEFEDIQSSSQKLQVKLLEYYGDELIVHKGTTKRGSIIFSASLEVEEALRNEVCFQNKLKTQIREVAFELRKSIMNAETKTLPNELQLQDIIAGEIEIPDIVLQFFSCLIGGPDIRRGKSAAKARRINSISSDVIFAATSGRKKPTNILCWEWL